MEQMVICSKNDLSALKTALIEKSLLKHIAFYKKDAIYYLRLNPEDIEEASFFIAEWLNQLCGKREILQILLESFDFLASDEMYAVKQQALKRLTEEKTSLIPLIQRKLLLMAESSSSINLDGFITFCMQGYRDEVMFLLEDCLDEYLAAQEYREFLELLHYFVELEESNFKCLHVVTAPDGAYRFYDEQYREITLQCIGMLQSEFPDIDEEETEKQNDILISLLVILVPKTVCVYGIQNVQNKKFLTTLQVVFENRIQFYEEIPQFLIHK